MHKTPKKTWKHEVHIAEILYNEHKFGFYEVGNWKLNGHGFGFCQVGNWKTTEHGFNVRSGFKIWALCFIKFISSWIQTCQLCAILCKDLHNHKNIKQMT